MTIEFIKILEAALEAANRSDKWFAQWKETKHEFDHRAWSEYEAQAEAYCNAYEILTGIRVIPCAVFIENEIAKA